MMFDKRLLKNFDFSLLLILLLLCAFGVATLYSATHTLDEGDPMHFTKRQILWLGVGLGGLLLICFIDYINFYYWARYLYVACLGLLVLVLFIGKTAGGSVRWIPLGMFDLQPSEIAKVIMIIVFARSLAEKEGKLHYIADLVPSLLYAAVPMGLIFLQPDLGTSLVFIALLVGMYYVAGVPGRYLLAMILAGVAALPVLWRFLQPYQKMRLIVFINPGMDPTHYGYQLMQSMISIGSGGLTGKGYLESTQVRLQFLPEHHTDFIFSVLGEEMGFLGAIGLLLLYFLLIYRILWIGSHSKDQFGALLCAGVAVLFTFQLMVNIGMTIGIMPVTGLPLPFMSYGNNALLVNMLAVGLVLNVGMRRHKIQF